MLRILAVVFALLPWLAAPATAMDFTVVRAKSGQRIVQRVAFERVQKKLFGRGEPDESTITGELKTTADLLPIFDAALKGKEWIAGQLSLADFALASTFMLRKPARVDITPFANVGAWIERLEARPSWSRAVAPMLEILKSRGVDFS